MITYVATIHAPEPVTLEVHAASDKEAAVQVLQHATGGHDFTLVRHDVTRVGPAGRGVTYDALEERLWAVTDGMGQRDSFDTFALLVSLIGDIMRRE